MGMQVEEGQKIVRKACLNGASITEVLNTLLGCEIALKRDAGKADLM
jgi:hypothetical protein